MRTRHTVPPRILFCLVFLCLSWPGSPILIGHGGRAISFPAPPDPDAIGTQVGAIDTYVRQVTLSPPASIHRLGLVYSEIRGTIEGIGWGGQPISLKCHYEYELSYVLRIPPGWNDGLVVHRHGSAALALWEELEANLGARSIGRIFHESADRHISDVALHPSRRWAFFAVNQVGVAPGGAHNTRLLGEPGCPEGMPVQSTLDVSIARDHALLAQHLMKILRGREPTMTLGTGHSGGPAVNFMLNAGVDHRRPGGPIQVGDNHRTPYDPASGRIFDGFLWMKGGFAGAPFPADQTGGLSAPTIFLAGEADRGMQGSINTISQMTLNPAVDVPALSRLYSVLNMPHIDADLVLSLIREGTDFTNPDIPEYFRGGGDRLKPLTAALLDALANWARWGIPPPPSVFNGEVFPDRVEFHRRSPPATSFPYVDDEDLDTYDQPPPVTPTPPLRAAWTNVRAALGGGVGSVVLPETACRRGGFSFFGTGPVGTHFLPFTEAEFLAWWGGSPASHQSCRVQTTDALAAAGFYDPTVVTIDVDPGNFPSVVDLRSPGRLAVAIFSTTGFDATEIVPGSLRLASARLQGVADNPGDLRARILDVNNDGRPDLLVEFRLERLRLNANDIMVDLWGRTRRGIAFAGSDLVQLTDVAP